MIISTMLKLHKPHSYFDINFFVIIALHTIFYDQNFAKLLYFRNQLLFPQQLLLPTVPSKSCKSNIIISEKSLSYFAEGHDVPDTVSSSSEVSLNAHRKIFRRKLFCMTLYVSSQTVFPVDCTQFLLIHRTVQRRSSS